MVNQYHQVLKVFEHLKKMTGSTAITPTLHTLHSADIKNLGSEEKLTK